LKGRKEIKEIVKEKYRLEMKKSGRKDKAKRNREKEMKVGFLIGHGHRN